MPIYKLRPASSTPENMVNANQAGWSAMDYSRESINDIQEVAPGDVTDTIVSLPTPLANLDLYRRAFETVVVKGFPNVGYFAQLVSRCLDIWEGLYNYDKNGTDVTFHQWDFTRIADLKAGSNGQRLLGRTLELFLQKQDNDNPFLNLNGITLIKFRNIPLAGTSPYTGFFLNYHGEEQLNWTDSKGKPLFSNDVVHLQDREPEFQKFIQLFRIAANNSRKPFISGFREFFRYLTESLNKSTTAGEIREKEAKGYDWDKFLQDYSGTIRDKNDETLQVLMGGEGYQLNMPSLSSSQEVDPKSAFFIKATLSPEGLPERPLVMGQKADASLRYHKRNWASNTDKPDMYAGSFEDNFEVRRLPGIGLQYPYLTVSDFLDEYLVNAAYPIHNKYFLTNHGEKKDISFLLPLKPLFFKYFKPEDLTGNLDADTEKPAILISGTKDMYKVELRIPVSGNSQHRHISLVRYYSGSTTYTRQEVQDSTEGIGQQRDIRAGLGIFPFMVTNNDKFNDYYKITLSDSGKVDLTLSFLDKEGKPMLNQAKIEDNAIGETKPGIVRRDVRAEKDPQSGAPGLCIYEVRNTYPAAMLLGMQQNGDTIGGYILPNWHVGRVQIGSQEAHFAVDFGTTNSHIAYTIGGMTDIKTLSYTPDDNVFIRFDAPDNTGSIADMYDPRSGGSASRNDILDFQRRTLMPSVLGKNQSAYGFPTRTVLTEKKAFGQGSESTVFGSQSFQFTYQTWSPFINDDTFTNLKWSEDERNPRRIETLLTQWMYIIRIICLKNGANPSKVKITRFIPNSMPLWQRTHFENIWITSQKNVFKGGEESIKTLSESEAPFHAYTLELNIESTTLSIDIGGGTTDVLLLNQSRSQNEILSIPDSFYFAGNSIYGDFLDFLDPRKISKANGLMLSVQDFVKKNLKDSQDPISNQVAPLYLSLLSTSTVRSEEVIDFMFKHTSTGLSKLLAGNEEIATKMRGIFLLHLGAILYYSGQLCRANGMPTPTNLLVSGTGSKYLNYITPNPATSLAEFALPMLIGSVESNAGSQKLKVFHAKNPKEATCEGGLVQKVKVIVPNKPKPYFGKDWKFKNPDQQPTYGELKQAPYNSDYAMVLDFIQVFISTCKKIDAPDLYNVSLDLDSLKLDLIENHANDTIRAVTERSRYARSEEAQVVETTFFYPIMGLIDRQLKTLTKLT